MASTWSNLGLRLMATGENDNTWGAQTNDNWNRMEDSTDGYMSVALSSTSHTATFTTQPTSYADEEGRQRVINYTGSPGGTCTVTLPNIEKVFVVRNNTDQSLIFTAGTGAQTVTLASGFDAQIYVDGSDEVHNCFDQMTGSVPTTAQVVTALSGATLTGALTIDNDLTLQGAAANIVFDESDNALEFADDAKAIFGAGGDLLIHHNGANSLIDSNTGELQILSDNLRLKNAANNETLAEFTNGSSCVLKFNDNTKLATTDVGVTVTGTLTATTLAGALPYGSLTGTPTIPSNNNQLTNGAGYVTSSGVTSVATGNGCTGGTITSTGTISMSGSYSGSFSASSNITAYSSDERLKDFKGKIDNALDKVDELNGYYFEWNDVAKGLDGGRSFKEGVEVGVSAQEIEKVLPEVVTEAPIVKIENLDVDYKTVYYDKIVPLLIEAIKELRAEVKELKKDR